MAAPRSTRPADPPFRNTLVAATMVHGIGLPVRLRLLALLIALVIGVVSAPFVPDTTDSADHGDDQRTRGFGRHLPFVPVSGDAE
ncbi:hypothetical protein J2X03_001128 [Microbacterium trichothecenolyticum]|nr:hypothetical protein [Microbacterium trichothecenolyticum]